MYRRLNVGITAFADRLCAIEPKTLMSLVFLTGLWVIWTVYVWTQNPFAR